MVPFLFAASLCLLNILLLRKGLEESLPVNRMAKVSWMAGIEHLKKAFTTPKLRSVFLMMFIFSFWLGIFYRIQPEFLIRHLNYSLGRIATFYAWVGMSIVYLPRDPHTPFLEAFCAEDFYLRVL